MESHERDERVVEELRLRCVYRMIHILICLDHAGGASSFVSTTIASPSDAGAIVTSLPFSTLATTATGGDDMAFIDAGILGRTEWPGARRAMYGIRCRF